MNYNGLAKIIPFAPRAQVRVGPPWSTAELGELFRVAHVLRQSGMMVETDMGLSDEGDPWFVFMSAQSEDVIAHFARINGEIVAHGLSASGVVNGATLADVIRRLQPVQAMERQQQTQTDRSVVLHPFMILVAFIAASFLATEESQAAVPTGKTGDTPPAAAETVSKIKADWIDRAMHLLASKGKERGDAPDLAATRKAGLSDSMHQSMALVMLAAAISQAQADAVALTNLTGDTAAEGRGVPNAQSIIAVADPETDHLTVSDAASATAAVSAPVTLSTEAEYRMAGPAPLLDGRDVPVLVGALDATASVLVPVMGSALPSAPLAGSGDGGLALPTDTLLVAEGQETVPETVPLKAVSAAPSAPLSVTAKTTAPTTSSHSAGVTATSLDITLEGGALQFHHLTVDLRQIEIVDTLDDPKVAPALIDAGALPVDYTGSVSVIAAPVVRTLTLTDAQDNILIGTGDIRIKNFTFGVDQLVFQDPALLSKQPDVSFSKAGDIILKFSETTRVVLIGALDPADILPGVATVAAV